jgi:hypothetical protein
LPQAAFTPITAKRKEYIPCGIDTSVMNHGGTKKENSEFIKEVRGYNPIFVYLGRQDICCCVRCGPEAGIVRKGCLSFWMESLLGKNDKETKIVGRRVIIKRGNVLKLLD